MGKIHKQIVSLLKESGKPMSLTEVADQVGKPEKSVFKALRKLFSDGEIECDNKNRTYYPVKK